MPQINAKRLLDDLQTLRSFGATGNGVVRPALSPTDVKSREWLAERYRAAGLTPTTDGVGNVLGRSARPGPALLIGSHSDTQPEGGWLDGALGVIYGLEIARACAEDPATAGLAIDAVSWQDEEGTYLGCLGSRSFFGVLDPRQEAAATDNHGRRLSDALREAGYADRPRLTAEPGRYRGYLEAHIEQGPYLEDAGEQIGVVTAIVGIRGLTCTITGEQNHAGTTSMARRRDAAAALYELAHRINTSFPAAANERTVWTMGRAVIEPGTASIVPGRAELDLQFRDQDDGVLDALERIAREIVDDINRRGKVQIAMRHEREPVRPCRMDAAMQEQIARAAERHAPGRWRRMPSAAGHDPMVIQPSLPCAMLFIPSIKGISHDFAEDSHEADIVAGCQVLADSAAAILASQ